MCGNTVINNMHNQYMDVSGIPRSSKSWTSLFVKTYGFLVIPYFKKHPNIAQKDRVGNLEDVPCGSMWHMGIPIK